MSQNLQKPIPLQERTKIRNKFMKAEGLRRTYTTHWCWHRLVKGRCPGNSCVSPSGLPHVEHADSFRRGKEWVMTYQPYRALTERQKARLDTLFREHGISWREEPEQSWHFPKETTLVVLERAHHIAHTNSGEIDHGQ